MTLTGILFIALMALLIVYLVFMLNNAIEDARFYSEMRNSTKKKKNGIPKIDPLPIPPPPVFNHEKEQKEHNRFMQEAGERLERRSEEYFRKIKDEMKDGERKNMEYLHRLVKEVKRLNFEVAAINALSNNLPELTKLLRQQIKDGLNPSVKMTLASESCSMKTFKAVQSYQCPLCEGRGVLLDQTGDKAVKCRICKGEGRVEL